MILYIYLQEFGERILKTLNICCFSDIFSIDPRPFVPFVNRSTTEFPPVA